MDRADIVEAARAWLGTPYVPAAQCCGVGADCLGFVLGLWRSLGGPCLAPTYPAGWGERGEAEHLAEGLGALLIPRSDAAPGAVVVIRLREDRPAQHAGVIGLRGADVSLIHAYSGRGVVETRFAPWRRRAVAFFDFP
ncbi:MAG: peptidase [Pseudomonadota bacterium]